MTKQRISSRLKNPVPLFAFLLVVLASFFVGIYRERVISFIFSRASIFAPQTGDTVSALTLKSTLNNKNFTLINVHVPYEGEIEKTDTFVAFDKLVEQSAFLPKIKPHRSSFIAKAAE